MTLSAQYLHLIITVRQQVLVPPATTTTTYCIVLLRLASKSRLTPIKRRDTEANTISVKMVIIRKM